MAIAFSSASGPEFDLYAGLAALWRLGAVAVFPEPATGRSGFRHAAKVTNPHGLLASPVIHALALLFPETRTIPVRLSAAMPSGRRSGSIKDRFETVADQDPALISFTSGSSGASKAMLRSHGLLRAQHAALSPLIEPHNDAEIDLIAFPAFVLTCLGHGTTAVMPNWNLRRHDRAARISIIRQAQKIGATRLLVPPVIAGTLAGSPLPPTVHRLLTGGGPLYPDVARKFLAGAPNIGLTVVYGSTEAEPIAYANMEAFDHAIWDEASAGAGLPVGAPIPGIKMKIIDDEIVVAGPHVNQGYLDPARNHESKINDGGTIWHRTGDAGCLDAKGQLWLLGQHSSSIDGLFPFAIESVARLWPGASSVAFTNVCGQPILFVAGDVKQLASWRWEAGKIGNIDVEHVETIPMDRRHRSKPDLQRLRRMLRRRDLLT